MSFTENPNVTRRRFLQTTGTTVAAASHLGHGTDALATDDLAPNFGKAKSVICLYLYGAPSQMETLDPKPDAPVEQRGDIGSISSSVPGIAVSELLPNVGKNLHRVALLRSMTHSSNNHAVSVALSGLSKSAPVIEANGEDERHWPYFGSVLEYLWTNGHASDLDPGIPSNMVLPWSLNHFSDPRRWSPHAAWLGKQYNPVIPRFDGKGSLEVGLPNSSGISRFDPFHGITTESTFRLDGAQLPSDVDQIRMARRMQLLEFVKQTGPPTASMAQIDTFTDYQQAAFDMIANPRVAEALDVTREPQKVRERYGLTLFGQSVLTARRLVEAGVKCVTAFWDDYKVGNNAWDTHTNHFPRIKNGLCPIFDQVLPAFLDDMDSRGLLEDTLVLVISEHGRTPAITKTTGGGREHWSGAYWGMFFGAGIQTNRVIGATDKKGAFPISHPTDPKDILATAYHLLGIDPHHTTIPDRQLRPTRLIPHGNPVRELLV
ncbi:MAG: DUF1501 domain-containing protein [Pirellulaceae bacterium]|nr:DUF1501 domain-containing protein [Pirellulaceae bacterium]